MKTCNCSLAGSVVCETCQVKYDPYNPVPVNIMPVVYNPTITKPDVRIEDLIKKFSTYTDEGYQVCPICKGEGLEPCFDGYNHTKICTVCNGEKIIHRKNGLPPTKQPK